MEITFAAQATGYEVSANGTTSHTITFASLAIDEERARLLKTETAEFGQEVYETLFQAETPARQALDAATTPENTERIYLVLTDKRLESIPWEYMHTGREFLATRHHLLRALPKDQRRAASPPTARPKLYALFADPARSRQRRIAVREAWDGLIDIARKTDKAVSLERPFPPTLTALSELLAPDTANIVHILSHGELADQRQGDAVLLLQDQLGDEVVVPANELIQTVRGRAALVVLNACLSAAVGRADLSNLAQVLVRDAVPYALGMQFEMAEQAALTLSQTFYSLLWRGASIEDALLQARRSILSDTTLPYTAWWAGMPALYTALDEPLPAYELDKGKPSIKPDPAQLQARQYIETQPSTRLVGRGDELVEIARYLQTAKDRRPRFITLHGIGGVGKTSLAYEAVKRNAWNYDWRIYWVSFEVLPSPRDFLTNMARHYMSDEDIDAKWSDAQLRGQVVQAVRNTRSILVIDNLETLLNAAHPAAGLQANPVAQELESILINLAGGESAILLTSREVTNWANEQVIPLTGLPEREGAQLFLNEISERRREDVDIFDALALSRRVAGHPLSLRLLAGDFNPRGGTLEAYIEDIEMSLIEAENRAPESLYDRERQSTLYACMDYSVARLPQELQDALRNLHLFEAPFIAETGAYVISADEQTGSTHLRALEQRGLLESEERGYESAPPQRLYRLHPMLRWYVDMGMGSPDEAASKRFGEAIRELVAKIKANYWGDARLRDLAQTSTIDLLAAGDHLKERDESHWAYNLASVFERQRQFGKAQELYQQSLAINRNDGDQREVAVTLSSMGDVHSQRRDFDRALQLYQEAVDNLRQVDDPRSVAVTLVNQAQALFMVGRQSEAVADCLEAQAILAQANSPHEVQQINELLIAFRAAMEAAAFDALYQQHTGQATPESLKQGQAAGGSSGGINPEQLDAIIHNTAAVMTFAADQRQGWLSNMQAALQQAQQNNASAEAALFQAIIALLQGETPTLPDDSPYAAAWAKIQQQIASGGPSSNGSASRLDPQELDVVVNNTAAVLTVATERHAEWLSNMQGALQQAQNLNAANEVSFLQAVVNLLNGQEVDFPPGSPYAPSWSQLQQLIQQLRSGNAQVQTGLDDETLNVIAHNTIAVLTEAPERLGGWRQNATDARNQATMSGDMMTASLLGAIVQLLDANGNAAGITPDLDERYAATWQRILDGLQSTATPTSTDDAGDTDDSAIEPEAVDESASDFTQTFVARAVAAIQGDGDVKADFMNWAYAQASQATWIEPLMQVMPRVLFGTPISAIDASTLPDDAQGVWQQIVQQIAPAGE